MRVVVQRKVKQYADCCWLCNGAVSDEEFGSISDLVKGRVKLTDVNIVSVVLRWKRAELGSAVVVVMLLVIGCRFPCKYELHVFMACRYTKRCIHTSRNLGLAASR